MLRVVVTLALLAANLVATSNFAGATTPGTFSSTGSMSTGRAGAVGVKLADGRVLVAGGADAISAVATAEVYDPASGTFSATTNNMTSSRATAAAVLLTNGKVLIVGGVDALGNQLDTAETFDPATGTGRSMESLNFDIGAQVHPDRLGPAVGRIEIAEPQCFQGSLDHALGCAQAGATIVGNFLVGLTGRHHL